MQLQLALDQLDLSEAMRLIDELQDLIDIAEIGTPMIIAEGLSAVAAVKRRFPAHRSGGCENRRRWGLRIANRL